MQIAGALNWRATLLLFQTYPPSYTRELWKTWWENWRAVVTGSIVRHAHQTVALRIVLEHTTRTVTLALADVLQSSPGHGI